MYVYSICAINIPPPSPDFQMNIYIFYIYMRPVNVYIFYIYMRLNICIHMYDACWIYIPMHKYMYICIQM